MATASSTSPGSDTAVPIFLDSNLQTHLSVLVSNDESVASLKRRIELEHASSFPDMGSITVKAIKVKVKGSLYRMSDSMKVNCVFQWVKGTRILHIDVVKAAPSEGHISSQKNMEKLNFGNEESLDFSLNPLSGPVMIPNPSVTDGRAEPRFQSESKAESKKVNTETNLDDATLRQTGFTNEENKGLEDNSTCEKQILSENPGSCDVVLITGETNNQACESGLPLNQANTDSLFNHDETRQSANQFSEVEYGVANNVQTKKGKYVKESAEEKELMDADLGEKTRCNEMLPEKNLVTDDTSHTEAVANSGLYHQENVNEEKFEYPTLESKQTTGTGSCIAKTKNVNPRKRGTKNGQDSRNVTQATRGVVIQKKAKVSSFDTLLCEVPNSVEDQSKQDMEKKLSKYGVKPVVEKESDKIVNTEKQCKVTKKRSKDPKPSSSSLRGLNNDVFLSGNTEGTNHVQNEVKMEDASEIKTDECSFMSDDMEKVKKGITSPGSSCNEERAGGDEILPILSQEEGPKQTALQHRQSLDDFFASYLYKSGGEARKTDNIAEKNEVQKVVCPLYLKQQKPLAACPSSCPQPSERIVSRHFQQQKRKTTCCTSSGLKCYVVEIDGVEKVISPYFDMPKGATFIREAQLARRKRAAGDSSAKEDHANNDSKKKRERKTKLRKEDHANNDSEKRERKTKQRSQLTAAEKKLEAYRRVPAGHEFRPPYSCHHLLQEQHCYDPWRVLVICMMLNVTTGGQVAKVLSDFFTLCPDAETTTKVQVHDIEQVIRSLGLQHARAVSIKRFTSEYLESDWTHVTQLHGVGKYAADAYATFCSGKLEGIRPQDHKLNDYWMFVYPDKLAHSEEPSSEQ